MAGGDKLEQRRVTTVPGRLLTLRPRIRPQQKTFSKCEQAWRWTRSVGVLILVGIVLAIAVLYSGETSGSVSSKYQLQPDSNSIDQLERRSAHLRRDLNKRHGTLWHHHDGIAAVRKTQGSLRKSTNILLLTYPDLTLSFLSDILTLGLKSAYFLEPILGLMAQPRSRTPEDLLQQDMLLGLFSCRWDALRKMASSRPWRIIRKLGGDTNKSAKNTIRLQRETDRTLVTKCMQTTVRLTETTRVRLHNILPLFDNAALDLKVVHLVSDPRSNVEKLKLGFLQSRYAARSNLHQDYDANSQDFCSQTVTDMDAAEILKRSQYFRIRFEDFVSDPMAVIRRLYTFLDLDDIPTAKEFLRKQLNKHRKANNGTAILSGYPKRTNLPFAKKFDKDCRKLVKLFGTKTK